MNNFGSAVTEFIIMLLSIVLVGLINGVIIMLLWNALCPQIFGLPPIGFLQGWGLSILGQLLLGHAVNIKEEKN